MEQIRTLGQLKRDPQWRVYCEIMGSVKDEIRKNVITRLQQGKPLFPGIYGYDDTVIPEIVDAILARQNFILLGLRGQAKSRIIRGMVEFLDEWIPAIDGCEINDHPMKPLCRRCRLLVDEAGDDTPITWVHRDQRYVEKLATPDVTVADLIGDLDPIRAAHGGHVLSDERVIHFGLLPRANRGIFAMNELPDLAPKVQVALFNIMQEGDIQIRGFPVRLPVDVYLIFTANPEDYTARGKIITPLKDRIGSEIRTHYPSDRRTGVAITLQESWIDRSDSKAVHFPEFIPEIVEEIAIQARNDPRVDQKSGVSQRIPISMLELVISHAEQRAYRANETVVVPRIIDIYAAMPALTGKLELEYEGEVRGAGAVARHLIRRAIGVIFEERMDVEMLQPVIDWFEAGGSVVLPEWERAENLLPILQEVPRLMETATQLLNGHENRPQVLVSTAEFLLEGLWAHKKIGRHPRRGYVRAEVRPPRKPPSPDFPTHYH